MSILSRWFGRKKKYQFTDEDRARSVEKRVEQDIIHDRIEYLVRRRDRLRAEYKARELEDEISEMEDDLAGDDGEDESEDGMLNDILSKVAPLLAAGTAGAAAAPAPQTEKLHLTDEQLLEYKARIPAPMLKKLQRMSDEELLALGKQYNPDVFALADDDTIQRALAILKR